MLSKEFQVIIYLKKKEDIKAFRTWKLKK